jgi:hypothetical protein
MTVETILSYGLKPVGHIEIVRDEFRVTLTNQAVAHEDRCIYAFVLNDEILRIGSCKSTLGIRMKSWQRDVSGALQRRKSPTSLAEAESWRETLGTDRATIFARPGTQIETAVGRISAYLAEETALIERHKPRFCRR